MTQQLTIDPEFRDWLPTVDDPMYTKYKTYAELESLILTHGCMDPITIWKGQNIILDGHRRHAICTKHNIPFQTRELEFPDRAAAMHWMDRYQVSRRNLGHQLPVIAARMAEYIRERNKSLPSNERTSAIRAVSEALGIGTKRTALRTIATGQLLLTLPADLRKRITSGEINISRKCLAMLVELCETDQRIVFREYDSDREVGDEYQRTMNQIIGGKEERDTPDAEFLLSDDDDDDADDMDVTSVDVAAIESPEVARKATAPPDRGDTVTPRPEVPSLPAELRGKAPAKPIMSLIDEATRGIGKLYRVFADIEDINQAYAQHTVIKSNLAAISKQLAGFRAVAESPEAT